VKLLAIDTSTEACSAALNIDDEITSRYEIAPRRHAELILPMVDALLADAQLPLTQLDGLAFGRGPGAFTGVRIATGVIQGLAFAADLPVIPISSLAALAQSVKNKADTIFAAFDARMGEIYYATFSVNADGFVELNKKYGCEEGIATPNDAVIPNDVPCFGIGSGWLTYGKLLSQRYRDQLICYEGEHYPNATETTVLAIPELKQGNTVPAELALPVYLRNKVTG